MSKIILGLIAGLVYGALDVALMLPMSFPDKTTALLGAFTSRFAIGFVIGCVQLPSWPGWLVGLLFGSLISLPDAMITHKYLPILVLGGIGGLVIGGRGRRPDPIKGEFPLREMSIHGNTRPNEYNARVKLSVSVAVILN